MTHRSSAAAGLAALAVAAGLHAQTVDEFLAGPDLGPVKSQAPAAGRIYVQETPGRHTGHRIFDASMPLHEPAAAPARAYVVRYHAWLKAGQQRLEGEVAAKEGMSGVGMTRPAGNFYPGGCIDVLVNRQGLGRVAPKLTRIVHQSGEVAAKGEWRTSHGTLTLTFLSRPGEDFCRVQGRIGGPRVRSVEVLLRAYPGVTKPTGQRVLWRGSQRGEVTAARVLAAPADTWFLLGDKQFDRAVNPRGRGPCAVMFTPNQIQAATASLGGYAVSVRLTLRPDTRVFHLALWEFKGWTNARALAHMQELGASLVVPIGRPAAGPVLVRNVPPRTLVLDGRPAATILLGAEPRDRIVQAALEVQRVVAESTGALLPVVSSEADARGHVVHLRVEPPGPGESAEGFRVRVGPRRTELIGRSPLAVFYAACELLEQGVGARWYVADPLGEIIPKHSTLTLPALDVRQSPSFPMRAIGRGTWALRNKQNRCTDGYHIHPGIYHTQQSILPHSRYFRERPEFFALIKGERSGEHECKLCYSNPDLVREVASNMAAMLDANPHTKLISLSPTDGQMWCECDECKAMDEAGVDRDRSKSRRSLLFYNAVAAELRKTHPKARMLVGAYNVYNWPAKDPRIKADPMLDVIITHYEDYCMAHPVGDPSCPRNRRYVELIKEWQALGCGVYFYEYYWKVNWFDLPWPIVHSVRGDMPWFKAQGCKGVYTQFSGDCVWAQFPVHYVAARLLWDVNADVDAIMAGMFDDLFGQGAEHMKAYWSLIERRMAECGQHFPGQGLRFGPLVFTPQVRQQMRRHYQAAVEANRDETVAERLVLIGKSLEYVDRVMRYVELKGSKPEEALVYGEALVQELRTDRGKWAGVVSRSVVRKGVYWSRELERLKPRAARRRLARAKRVQDLPKTWRFALDSDDVGQKEGWFRPGHDDRSWKPIEIARTWESQGYDYDGFAWYRTDVPVQAKLRAKPLALHFESVDGEAWVYWNGKLLGHHAGWDEPFRFRLDPKGIHTDRPNCLAVRVYDGSNAGGIYRPAYLTDGR